MEKYEKRKKVAEWLNTLGYDIEFDEDGLWMEEYGWDEFKTKDIIDLIIQYNSHSHPEPTPPPLGTLSPAEWLEKRDIDTYQIVSYFCRDGVGEGIDIDVEELMADYARHVAGVVAGNVRHRAADSGCT